MRILLKEQGCRISSRSDLKRRSLGLLEEHRLNKRTKKKKIDNMMSSDMGSLPGPKNTNTYRPNSYTNKYANALRTEARNYNQSNVLACRNVKSILYELNTVF